MVKKELKSHVFFTIAHYSAYMPTPSINPLESLPPFIAGLDLNRQFFQQIIKPLMDQHFPGLRYAAGIVGEGSDVLRFDTPLSMDHNWGPHMRIFLGEENFNEYAEKLDYMFRHELPYTFMGFPTNFTKPANKKYLVQQMKSISSGPVNHLIQFFTVKSFFKHYLGVDPHKRITRQDWLTFPQQALIEVSRGEIYYDTLGIEKIRKKFHYYPDDIWYYMYYIQWERIKNLEAYVGRSGQVGDELGSAIVASRLAACIMELCFLIEKKYIPYAKWFGTAFTRLKCAPEFTHVLLSVTNSPTWTEREEHLGHAYEILARMHNELKLTRPIATELTDYNGRPFKVIDAWSVSLELEKHLKAPFFKDMKYKIGAIDQFISHARINHMNYVYRKMKNIIQ